MTQRLRMLRASSGICTIWFSEMLNEMYYARIDPCCMVLKWAKHNRKDKLILYCHHYGIIQPFLHYQAKSELPEVSSAT